MEQSIIWAEAVVEWIHNHRVIYFAVFIVLGIISIVGFYNSISGLLKKPQSGESIDKSN